MDEQNICNCCDGLSVQVPVEITNRPGLDAIAYRIGTHPQFRQSLLARLSLSGERSLEKLTTRENNDFSIALLDAWSVVADVLSFYQERIANENYLRTATERYSVLEMARLIGYELRPGVAASTYLSFTLEETAEPLITPQGTNQSANKKEPLPPIYIEKGTKVQSVPGPGEKPQTFETDETIEARAGWNTIRPRLTQPLLKISNGIIVFKGISNNLREGDLLLFKESTKLTIKKILKTWLDMEAKATWVYLDTNASLPKYNRPSGTQDGNINELLVSKDLDENLLSAIISKTWKEEDLAMLIATKKWPVHELLSGMEKLISLQNSLNAVEAFVFRKHAFAFGYNAPRKLTLSATGVPTFSEWVPTNELPGKIFLDSAYDEVVSGNYFAIQTNADINTTPPDVYSVNSVSVRSHRDYEISTRATEVNFTPKTPNHKWWGETNTLSLMQSMVLHVQSEKLLLDELPIEDTVEGISVTLSSYFPGLKPGQLLIVTGDRNDLKGVSASELVQLKQVIVENGFTILIFKESLAYPYIRRSVIFNANVAAATNGESTEEVLGSGDAAKVFQQFTLRQPPLTYTSAAAASGTQSTLEIWVNNLRWHQADNFLEHLADERIYIIRQDGDGKTRVIFGDGVTGSRLPSGQENIKAKYRKGIGLGGLVKAKQLSQLMTKPLGVKSAVNPLAPGGAADRETFAEAKRNAPLTILTLERIVSLQDYEDFARSFAGIEKALATWTWIRQQRHIFLTIAGTGGQAVKKDSQLYDNLLKAIRKSGDPKVPVTVENYVPKYFRVACKIQPDPDYNLLNVVTDVEQKLRNAFSFSLRSFGQGVNYSEVVSIIQQIDGVIAVDLDKLYFSDQPEQLLDRLEAGIPQSGTKNIIAAELLMLDPRPIDIKIMT